MTVKIKKLGDKLGDRFNSLTKNRQKLLELIDKKPTISIEQLSKSIGISTTAIENNIRFLKENHLLKRVGKAKDGSWEIVYEEEKWN